jgi:hypothetical protein
MNWIARCGRGRRTVGQQKWQNRQKQNEVEALPHSGESGAGLYGDINNHATMYNH